jgi:hypothetical protein
MTKQMNTLSNIGSDQHFCRHVDRFPKPAVILKTRLFQKAFVICSEVKWKEVFFPMMKNG